MNEEKSASKDAAKPVSPPAAARIVSVDALRGLVVFTMIFVNDIAGVSSNIVPAWMRHFHGKSGMTFVDLVFPAFLFIVGMSLPFALGGRLKKGEPLWKTVGHVAVRTVSLLAIGILMVHETPDSEAMGWSGPLWCVLMFLSAIFAFSSLSPTAATGKSAGREKWMQVVTLCLRGAGQVALIFLALAFRGPKGQQIVTLSPFVIHTSWYGILGLIGWAYLVSAMAFLVFRSNRTALLACVVILLCLYPAAKKGAFDDFWLSRIVNIGETLGALPSIAVAGVLLASIVAPPETMPTGARVRFTLWFIAGSAAGALLLHRLYGISKNAATPSWCLWSCAITAAFWLLLHLAMDGPAGGSLAKLGMPLAVAGGNVLLAYLLSEMLPSLLELTGLDDWYSRLAEHGFVFAVARSAGCAALLLALTALLNRFGFRLKL